MHTSMWGTQKVGFWGKLHKEEQYYPQRLYLTMSIEHFSIWSTWLCGTA